jgi:hypothetical protein
LLKSTLINGSLFVGKLAVPQKIVRVCLESDSTLPLKLSHKKNTAP